MSVNDKLDIKISTTADTGGADRAAAALGKVTAATQAGAAQSKDAAKAANDLGENFDKGAAAGRVLGEVSRGNVLALGQLGAALKAIGALLRANLIGGLITLGAIGASILLPIIKGFQDKKKAVEDTGKALDAAKAAAQRLGEQRLETLGAELERISAAAQSTVQDLEASLAAAEKLAEAQDRLDLARIEADTSLTEEQRVGRRAAVAERAAARRSASAVSQAEGIVGARRGAAGEFGALETQAADRFTAAARRVDAIDKQLADANALIAATNAEFSRRVAEIQATTPAGTEQQARILELGAEIQARQAPAVATRDLLNSPQGQLQQAAARGELAAAEKALAEANAAALKSAQELTDAERNLSRVRATQEALAPIEAQTRAIETGRAATAARERDAARTREGARSATLELIGSDAANSATRLAVGLQGSAAGRADPAVKAAADSLRAAAQAAREGGATEAEAQALIDALIGVREVLAANGRTSATLQREIASLKSQVASLRN